MLTAHRVSRAAILYSENAITNRNAFGLRADVEGEEKDYDN